MYQKIKVIAVLAISLTLSGCGTPTMQVEYLPVSPTGKSRYAVSGVVMVKEFKHGVTKPYIDKMMQGVCLNDFRYISLQETINKEMGISVWVQWNATLECK